VNPQKLLGHPSLPAYCGGMDCERLDRF